MFCESCGNEQETGKFCGKCGTQLTERTAPVQSDVVESGPQAAEHQQNTGQMPPINESITPETIASHQGEPVYAAQPQTAAAQQAGPAYAAQPQQPAQPNVNVEKVKETSKAFWNYYLHYLKNPSKIFENQEREFVNGLISIAVFAVIVGIATFNATPRNELTGLMMDTMGPSIITVLISSLVVTAISTGIVTLALFLTNKFFGPELNFKEIISVFGSHMTPFTLVAAVALVLLFLKSYLVGNLLLLLSVTISFGVLPLYLIGRFLSQRSKSIDPLYGFLSYIVMAGILFSIITAVLADSLLGSFFDMLSNLSSF